MATKYCSNCGSPSATISKFCSSCGQSLDSVTRSTVAKAKASSEEDDPEGSDAVMPDIDSIAVTTEMDEENERFGKSFSFGGGSFNATKFKPRSLTR